MKKHWPETYVTITWVRRNWGEGVLRKARRATLIVTRYGKPCFVLLSPARYLYLREESSQSNATKQKKPRRKKSA